MLPVIGLAPDNGQIEGEGPLTADTTDDQDFLAADVGHRSLCYLHEHGEDGLLERETQVGSGEVTFVGPVLGWAFSSIAFVVRQRFRSGQDPGEANVHALCCVR